MLANVRTQHPVGQGFFHSAFLTLDSHHSQPLRLYWPLIPRDAMTYVYDCGAQTPYLEALNREIQTFRLENSQRKLDFLFISHFHNDHVNGIPSLLEATNVDTVVMPFLGVIERIIVFAKSVADGAAPSSFYQNITVDPVGTLAPYARQIVLVTRASDDDDGAPADDLPPVDGGPADNRDRDSDIGWKFVGRHPVRSSEIPNAGDGASATRLFVTDDVNAFLVPSHSQQWLFSPYVHQGLMAESAFIAVLAQKLGLTDGALRDLLRDNTYRATLVSAHQKELVAAFRATVHNLNLTSMCLYSGPVPGQAEGVPKACEGRFVTNLAARRTDWIIDETFRGYGWLATGDANLKANNRLAAFLSHYRRLVGQVVAMTVPHHGSADDSGATLYDAVRPLLCIAAADSFSNWSHPAASVTRAIASSGAVFAVVTSTLTTKVQEVVHLPH